MFLYKKIVAVIPTYNEELLIGKVIGTMPEYVDYIVVMDQDRTAAVAKKIS